MMENLALIFERIALGIDVFGLSVLVLGFTRGASGWLLVEFKREPWEIRAAAIRKLRCVVGIHIIFALELMIVSDIIVSFVAVAVSEPGDGNFFRSDVFFALAQLSMIILIRTVLDYFLSKELRELQEPTH